MGVVDSAVDVATDQGKEEVAVVEVVEEEEEEGPEVALTAAAAGVVLLLLLLQLPGVVWALELVKQLALEQILVLRQEQELGQLEGVLLPQQQMALFQVWFQVPVCLLRLEP